MNTVRRQSLWGELERLHEQLTRRAQEIVEGGALGPVLAPSYPLINLWQDEASFHAEAELPGVAPEDVEVLVQGGDELTLQGERKVNEIKGTWHRRERGFGKFRRVLKLPLPVDADRVEARFENGVLRVTLPKAAAARPRRIPVSADTGAVLEQSQSQAK